MKPGYSNGNDEGYEENGKLMDKEPFFIEFNDYGFRLYMKEGILENVSNNVC